MKAAGAGGAEEKEGSAGEGGESQGVRSVQRALDILGLLTDERPAVTISDIVKATGLAKTTAIRLAQTLELNGLLWATSKGYMAGPGLWRWAHLARQTWELPAEMKQLMRELGDRQRETVNLYVLRDMYRVCVAQQESTQPLRHVVRVGDELPLWGGASSKVLLREASPALLKRIARSSPYGADYADSIHKGLTEAAEQGFAVSHGEREAGLSAVAVPVLGKNGSIAAALSLSGPTVRFSEDRIAEFVADLTESASRMSERGFDYPFAG
ncbi:IclR family transcriptional regulator [Amycolatopsis sp. NPDC051106]|uniref:IclR family transcriptional regulator n=1 Tax=unclassified Amycolatopsis TaxID=2618356 RepID=UPI003426A0CA